MKAKNSLIDSFKILHMFCWCFGVVLFQIGIDEKTGYEVITPVPFFMYFGFMIISNIFCNLSVALGLYISTTQTNLSVYEFLKIVFNSFNDGNMLDIITYCGSLIGCMFIGK